MGTDIHMFIEVKKNGTWVPFTGTWEDLDPFMNKQKVSQQESKWGKSFAEDDQTLFPSFYTDRNYDLFAILANVRNGYGFGGIPTGSGFKPIDMPRGLPKDVSKEVEKESEAWGEDAHSHSYFTLKELKLYDWHGQVVTHTGVVDFKGFLQYQMRTKPTSYSGDVVGGSIKKVSAEEMSAVIRANEGIMGVVQCSHCGYHNTNQFFCQNCKEELQTTAEQQKEINEKLGSYFTRIYWDQSYYSCCRNWVDYYIPLLSKFAEDYEDLRIIFWFDN